MYCKSGWLFWYFYETVGSFFDYCLVCPLVLGIAKALARKYRNSLITDGKFEFTVYYIFVYI